MKRILLLAVITALSIAGIAQAKGGPITKQSGSSAVLTFTSICRVPGDYVDWICGGDEAKYDAVEGKLTAMQREPKLYDLKVTFANLTPGTSYRLWATRDAVRFGGTWLEVGRGAADEAGSLQFKLQGDPESLQGLGFDLNTLAPDVTVMTSWWSGQRLVVNDDGSLAAG